MTHILPFSKRGIEKRAESPSRAVGDKITLKGFGNMRFEVVEVSTHGDETFYKVKPVEAVYGVPERLVEEERHSEKRTLGSRAFPFSKRADETPVIPIGRERARREIDRIREENQRQISETGMDKPPEYPERHTFFGEQFLPGDIIVTKKEPGKPWKIIDRQEDKRLGVAYSTRSMEERLVWAQDVAAGMKGAYLLKLPESEWDVPGKGLPPTGPKAVEEPPRRLTMREKIEEENKHQLAQLTPSERAEEERNRQKWFRLQPVAEELVQRLEPLAKGQDTFDHPNRELKLLREQLELGYRARLVHQFEGAVANARRALESAKQ